MVDSELQPERTGVVPWERDAPHAVDAFVTDIGRHGEVHATFEDVDGEVECRLGTTKVEEHYICVYDGDQWNRFAINNLVTWDVPMNLYHE